MFCWDTPLMDSKPSRQVMYGLGQSMPVVIEVKDTKYFRRYTAARCSHGTELDPGSRRAGSLYAKPSGTRQGRARDVHHDFKLQHLF